MKRQGHNHGGLGQWIQQANDGLSDRIPSKNSATFSGICLNIVGVFIRDPLRLNITITR